MVYLQKPVKNIGLVLICASLLSACSVFSAMDGKEDPNLKVVIPHMSRMDIDNELGDPIKVEKQPDGTVVAVYEYVMGKDPSILRAYFHTGMDISTLGLWEFAGGPLEEMVGKRFVLKATYDVHQRLISAKETCLNCD